MPNRPAQAKSLRRNKKRRERNQAVKSQLRTERNRFNRMLERGDVEEATEQVRKLTRLYQRAASKGVVHENKAARKQSQFERRLRELKQEQEEE
jgi:small subunit ribosomal protein S20